MSTDEIKLEDLLDSVADAVSALVVFASEVQTDKKKLANLKEGVQVVQQATSFFTSEASRTIKLWHDLGYDNMGIEMKECCDGINEASSDCVSAANALNQNSNLSEPKQKLLDAGKAILKHMVRLLQLNDLYEVTIILKQIQVLRQLIETRDSPNFVCGEFSLMTRFLSKLLSARVKRCHDSKVRSTLDETAIDVGKVMIPMMDVQQEFLDSGLSDNILKERRDMLLVSFNIALKRAHEATKLSAKSPFDLSMLDRDLDQDFDEDFVAVSDVNWNDGLDALTQAIRNGDESDLESALRAIRKDVLSQLDSAEDAANKIEDPNLRDKLLAALARLREQLNNMMDKLTSDARNALKNRDPEAIKAAIDELKRLRAKILDGLAKDNLLQHAVNIDSLMKSLLESTKAGDRPESNAIVSDIGNEVNDIENLINTLVANVDDDAFRRARLEEGIERLKKHLAALGQVVPDVLDNPNKDDLWKRLQDLMDRIRGVTNDLVNASMQTTPQELLGLGANVNEALKRLKEAAEKARQDPDGVSVAASNVLARLKPQLELATNYASSADPQTAAALNKKIEEAKSAAATMASAAKDVTNLAKKGPNTAGLDDALARLRNAIDQLRAANNGLVDASILDPESEMKILSEAMQVASRKVNKALEAGDIKSAAAAMSEFQELGKRKVFLAQILAEDTDDLNLRQQLLDLSKQLELDIGKGLVDAMKNSLKNSKDEAARKEAARKLEKALATAAALDKLGTASSPEDKYTQNGKVMIRTAEMVKLGVQDGNFTDAAGHLKALREQLARHRQLANAISENCAHDPSIGKRLHDQCDQLDDIYKQIVVATKAAMADPSQKAHVAALVAKFQTLAGQSAAEADNARNSRAEAERRAKEEADRLAKQRALQEEEMAGKNEIYKAAHKVTQAVGLSLDDLDGSPQAMLIRCAAKIAEAMKVLSELSEGSDTKATIEQARNIANFVNEIMRWANRVAEECSDPKLASELKDAATVAKNFSIQLKIVCAVKASSGDDQTAAKSLVTCAQGLCKNVVECVNVSRIAKLKKKLL